MNTSQLKAIAEELQTQDNDCTGDPIFVVNQIRRITGLDPQYIENYCFMDEEGDEVDLEEEGLTEEQAEEEDWLTKVYYADESEVVNFHFTRKAAEKFIAKYGHNYNCPSICIESLYRCQEMIDLRNWLLSGEPARVLEENELLKKELAELKNNIRSHAAYEVSKCTIIMSERNEIKDCDGCDLHGCHSRTKRQAVLNLLGNGESHD
jgi:hypothetical protein